LHPCLVSGRRILELGAGGALPSLISAIHGAKKVLKIVALLIEVVITDYPDVELIDNIKFNVANCGITNDVQARIAVEGYLWGSDSAPLLSHLDEHTKFNIIILSDTVFNHSEHPSLVKSLHRNLEKHSESRVYVFYTHHRPWLKDKDLAFFELASEAGFTAQDILLEHVAPMFQDDRGDEIERGTVYGRQLKWS
jgi:nicotinamide N-methyltransferase